MKAAIYINNDNLQFIIQKGKTYSMERISLPEGTIVNGVITDEYEIVEVLKGIRKEIKEATLILDSSNILMKRLNLPQLPKKSLEGVIRSEFDMGYDKEYYYDWRALSESGNENTVLACALPEEFLDKYFEVFAEAKLKITKVDITTNGIDKFVQQDDRLKGQTLLMNVVKENMLVSILFVEGEYRLLKRNRIINQPGTSLYVDEIYSKYTAMIQFCKSQNIDSEMLLLYYVGLEESALTTLTGYIKDLDQRVQVKGHGKNHGGGQFFYTYLGLLNSKKDINLLRAKRKASRKLEKKTTYMIGMAILSLVSVIAPYTYYTLGTATLEKEIQEANKYIEQVNEGGMLERLTMIMDMNENASNRLKEYQVVVDNLEESTLWNSNIMKDVYKATSLETLYYSAWNRSVSISGRGEDASELSKFVETFRGESYADELDYLGYTKVMVDNKPTYRYGMNLYWDATQESEEIQITTDAEVESNEQ